MLFCSADGLERAAAKQSAQVPKGCEAMLTFFASALGCL
jgi:hypothetical protein